MRLVWLASVAALLPLAPAASASAQTLAQRIAAAGADEPVHFSYESRPGVCGDGENIMMTDGRSESGMTVLQHGRGRYTVARRKLDRDGKLVDCEFGPVTMELERSGGRITEATARVGGTRMHRGRDLGSVPAVDAVAYLLADAVYASDARAAERIVFAATLANAESWPQLLQLARDRTLADKPRRTSIFWLGQAAGAKATEGLTSVIGDDSDEMEVRKAAVFALSQIRTPETIDALIDIARANREPAIRKNAIFWLAQTRDPKALSFFEEVLRR
jgi:HEAT repeats